MLSTKVLRTRYRFRNPEDFSPTQYQLEKFMQAAGWKRTRWAWRAKFTERNLNFSEEVCECLEYKHLLANLLHKYCPQIAPETYILNDYTWPTVLSDLAQDHYTVKHRYQDEIEGLVWILKPALLNNGQYIKIFKSLSQIEDHMLSTKRLGGPHVLQRYIMHPDLYEGRKYSLRFFVVLTSDSGAFLYQKGYLNVALTPYSDNFTDLRPHLTNEHLYDNESSVVQIPTAGLAKNSIWYPQVKNIVSLVTDALEKEFPHVFMTQKERSFSVFGFDFMCDDKNNMLLLEINHGPCFPIEPHHPLQEVLYQDFWRVMVTQFVLPIAYHHPISKKKTGSFEAL